MDLQNDKPADLTREQKTRERIRQLHSGLIQTRAQLYELSERMRDLQTNINVLESTLEPAGKPSGGGDG